MAEMPLGRARPRDEGAAPVMTLDDTHFDQLAKRPLNRAEARLGPAGKLLLRRQAIPRAPAPILDLAEQMVRHLPVLGPPRPCRLIAHRTAFRQLPDAGSLACPMEESRGLLTSGRSGLELQTDVVESGGSEPAEHHGHPKGCSAGWLRITTYSAP